jgi:hypothetical protein
MRSKPTAVAIMCIFGSLSASSSRAQDIDLSGAWANHESACAQVFVKSSKGIAFSEKADFYGSGFVIEANRIRGRIATCAITLRKKDGAVVHLVATCSTDIALQNMQFSLRVEDKDRIVRIYPGLPELDTTYFHCPM